jgi:peroxiredoxin family protein
VSATDPGFFEDIKAWARMSKNELIDLSKTSKGVIEASLRKGIAASSGVPAAGGADKAGQGSAAASGNITGLNNTFGNQYISSDSASMVVFSGDLDKAIASFIIANGAASSGKNVTMFFTFWGLNILRKHERVSVKKDLISRMFGMMMPRGSRRLKLSKMSMSGMGGKMIRMIMKKNNVLSLEELIQTALRQGVKIVACTMSMELMGIAREELIDGIEYGGVGYYIGEADKSGINLFI